MNDSTRKVLEALTAWPAKDGWYVYSRTIAEQMGEEPALVRAHLTVLYHRGYVGLSTIFDEGTGLAAGSGYAITAAGQQALSEAAAPPAP